MAQIQLLRHSPLDPYPPTGTPETVPAPEDPLPVPVPVPVPESVPPEPDDPRHREFKTKFQGPLAPVYVIEPSWLSGKQIPLKSVVTPLIEPDLPMQQLFVPHLVAALEHTVGAV